MTDGVSRDRPKSRNDGVDQNDGEDASMASRKKVKIMGKLLDTNVPIYIQIMDNMKHMIVSGELKTGDKIQSVREMAQEWGVNPNTVQRSLLELEREGLLETERAQGRYVAADEETIVALRMAMAKEAAGVFLEEMKALGLTTEEIHALLKLDGKQPASEASK